MDFKHFRKQRFCVILKIFLSHFECSIDRGQLPTVLRSNNIWATFGYAIISSILIGDQMFSDCLHLMSQVKKKNFSDSSTVVVVVAKNNHVL
jgi:hypothetical protein